ncbi:MAG: aspartate kinase [Pseudomonadales bacterium]|nr:aspartate kinase [Pseudomonadales bacterium]MDG2077884.1 aspartate kinase [Pseudomonadales bacterium]
MALIVQKYGGTSVGTTDRIKAVATRVKRFVARGDQVVVVVSAMSGETNRLMALAGDMGKSPSARELDVLLSTGEQVTIALLAMALHAESIEACSYTGSQVRILTDDTHGKARIKSIDDKAMRHDLQQGRVVVVAGFQGSDDDNNITTLGRGGSDTTAVALAAALKADECQIYTDVDGVYTTDPRVVESARRLGRITFEEMLEMASLGSKVLQIRAVEFAGKYQVPLRVLSSFEEGEGTLISVEGDQPVEAPLVSGIAFNRDEARVVVRGVPDTPGVAYKVIGPVSDANIEVDVIVQNVAADGSTDFAFTVHRNELDKAQAITESVAKDLNAREVSVDANICKVSLVGVGMRSHAGIASKMFQTLAEVAINIELITTSEIKISVVIEEKFMELAVRSLHAAFDLDQPV